MTAMPMFPLGSVLLPGFALSLHVFEPRYRELTRHCLEHGTEFGVVLIERGSEVGGGDVRSPVGVAASIADFEPLPDGRFALAAVGTQRFRVTEWLAEEPYPLADTEAWPDGSPFDAAALSQATDLAAVALRELLSLLVEIGELRALPTLDRGAGTGIDLVQFGYRLCGLAPFGPADHQALLTAPTPDIRIDLLTVLLREATDDVRRRIELGP